MCKFLHVVKWSTHLHALGFVGTCINCNNLLHGSQEEKTSFYLIWIDTHCPNSKKWRLLFYRVPGQLPLRVANHLEPKQQPRGDFSSLGIKSDIFLSSSQVNYRNGWTLFVWYFKKYYTIFSYKKWLYTMLEIKNINLRMLISLKSMEVEETKRINF